MNTDVEPLKNCLEKMYINFKALNNAPIAPISLMLLIALKQNKTEDCSNILETYSASFNILEEQGYVEYVKPKNKKQTKFELARLSKKGQDLVETLTSPEVSEEDEVVLNWLVDRYKKLGKDVGNKKRTGRHIRDFRIASGICKNNLINLCLDFLHENEEKSRVLEYVFYYPKTVFATKFVLDDSWLYKHYLRKQDYFDNLFKAAENG
jgi:hypothetical protein